MEETSDKSGYLEKQWILDWPPAKMLVPFSLVFMVAFGLLTKPPDQFSVLPMLIAILLIALNQYRVQVAQDGLTIRLGFGRWHYFRSDIREVRRVPVPRNFRQPILGVRLVPMTVFGFTGAMMELETAEGKVIRFRTKRPAPLISSVQDMLQRQGPEGDP